MADWAEWCEIISRSMGEKDDAFINSYNENIHLQTEEVIEGSDLAIAVRELVSRFDDEEPEYNGTPTDLLVKLNLIADVNNIDRRNKYWPKTAARLSYNLKILLKTLREVGIEVVWERDTSTKKSRRIITIRYLSSEASERQNDQNPEQNEGQISDDIKNEEIEVSSEEKDGNRAQNDVLYVTEDNPSFVSGEIRMRAKNGGSYPYKYVEMIDNLFGPDDNTIEVCSRSVKGLKLRELLHS